MADTIYLDSFAMDKLICLCAHDFKHDFLEDSDRPKLALGSDERFDGGSQTVNPYSSVSQTQTQPQQLSVLRIREKQNEKYVVNPEDFPLACYIYLNIADMCKNDEAKTLDTFNKFCDNLGKINGRIGLQEKRREAARLGADAAESRQKRRKKGGNPSVGGSLQPTGLQAPKMRSNPSTEEVEKAMQSRRRLAKQSAIEARERGKQDRKAKAKQKREEERAKLFEAKRAREGRTTRSRPPAGAMAECDDVGPVDSNKLIEWDKMLDIYKEWLLSPGRVHVYQDLNNVLNTKKPPREGDKRSFLIPSSEWEDYEDSVEYNRWSAFLGGGKSICQVKTGFNNIINQCLISGVPGGEKYPHMIAKKISIEKWNNIRQFSQYLLKEWEELVIANPGDDSIYNKNQIINLGFKDENMWIKSENYYNDQAAQRRTLPQPQPTLIKGSEKCIDDERTIDNCSPFKIREGGIFYLTSKKKIINNSATLSKYINDPEKYYTCPIPSIIDPQSVCNSIPPKQRVGDENRDIHIPADYSVNVVDQLTRRTIDVQIKNDPQLSTSYRTTISFNGAGGQSINESRINDFRNGGSPLSAYNVTLMFIQGFLKNREEEGGGLNEFGDWVNTEHTDPMSDPVTPFSQDKATLRSIAGIFALKLMGDFSQELYAISKNSTIGPLLFLANDRVSAARYLLLKVHGMREAGVGNIIAEPGGGGFLGYSRPKNNYFLLVTPPPQPGGGKKKKKVKKTKTKRKSRKKVKKTKRKSRKSRKKRK